jgi:hypothetical protein
MLFVSPLLPACHLTHLAHQDSLTLLMTSHPNVVVPVSLSARDSAHLLHLMHKPERPPSNPPSRKRLLWRFSGSKRNA